MDSSPLNALVHLGNDNGTVTLWSPNQGSTPLAKILCHKSGVTALCCSNTNYMCTGGREGIWKLWDMRKLTPLATYEVPGRMTPSSLAISQRGVVAVGYGGHVQVRYVGCFIVMS